MSEVPAGYGSGFVTSTMSLEELAQFILDTVAQANAPFTGAAITGSTIDSSTIGATTASTGKFTTLAASSTVSGTGFSTYLASPPAIGGTAAAAVTGTVVKGTTSLIAGATNTITSGSGAPGATQPNGSLYLRTDGAANTRLYISEGAGTWAAVTSS